MRALAWAGRAVLGSAVLLCAVPAGAQDRPTTTVLGLTTEGPDDTLVAENLTAVLRRAVDEERSVRHTGRESTLAQMSLAFGCEDQRATACLQQIGQELQSERLISGSITRTTRGGDWAFRVEVWMFDVEAGHEMSSASAQFGRSRSDIDDLRDLARTLVGRLLGGGTGSLEIRSEADGARVHLDGERAGEVTGGRLVIEDVETGEHHVEIDADGYEPYETAVTVQPGETARVRARLVETGGGGEPPGGRHRGGIGALQWVGIGTLLAGAIMGVVAIAWAVDVSDANNSAAWNEYRHRFPSLSNNQATAACDATFDKAVRDNANVYFDGLLAIDGQELTDPVTGATMVPQGLGDDITLSRVHQQPPLAYPGSTSYGTIRFDDVDSICMHRTGQWVLGGLAVAAGVVGTYLVFGTGHDQSVTSEETDGADDEEARVQLLPILSSEQRGLGLRLTF